MTWSNLQLRFGNFPNGNNWLYHIPNGLNLNQGKSVGGAPSCLPSPSGNSGPGVYDDVTRAEGFGRSSVELEAAVKILVRNEHRKNLSGFFESILLLLNTKRFNKLFCMAQRGRNFGNWSQSNNLINGPSRDSVLQVKMKNSHKISVYQMKAQIEK